MIYKPKLTNNSVFQSRGSMSGVIMEFQQKILNNPMLSLNYRIWRVLGFSSRQDKKGLFLTVPGVFFTVLQLSYVIFSKDNLFALGLYGYFTALHFNCVVRLLMFFISLYIPSLANKIFFYQFRIINTMSHIEGFEKFLIDFCDIYDGIMVGNIL